jgi:endonuclease/exonuclease/phosphatase (EEP) superfamily protein YafD
MAYRKKATLILAYKPDVVVVSECEHPDKLKFNADDPIPTDILWHGTNQNKGLGIFSYNNYKLRLLDMHDPNLKTILPIAVTGGSFDFTLFAIWAYNPLDKDYNYIGQVWKAIHHYESILKGKPVILAGDFNSNVFWDKLNRKSNHTMVVEKLTSLNIFSAYHIHQNLPQGKEAHPTYFMYRHQNKPYHVDYCFASADLIDKLERLEIGTFDQWAKYSDHNPLIVSFKL